MTESISSQPVRLWREGEEACPLRLVEQGQVVVGRVMRRVFLGSIYRRPSVDGVPRHTSFAYIVEWHEGENGTGEPEVFFGDNLVYPDEAREMVSRMRLRRIRLSPVRLDESVRLHVCLR